MCPVLTQNEFTNRMKKGTTFKKIGTYWDLKADDNDIDFDQLNVDD